MVANPWAMDSQKKKPKPNLKTDGSKPNLRMVAKTEIRNGETELIASASNSSNRAHHHRSSLIKSKIGHRLGLASQIGDRNSTDWIGDSFHSSRLDVLPSLTMPPPNISLPTPST